MHPSLNIEPETLARFCHTHRIRRLSLLGLQIKGTATAQSGIDLLVEFEPEAHPTLLELAGALNGRKVDVRTAEELSPHFRGDVVRMAKTHYVAG